jgi:diguanylate cyclase (GGDEF)-like protein/PAS domain S-box-containing protein
MMAEEFGDVAACRAEIQRLNKIIRALMNRAERSTHVQGSDFSLFQSTAMLEEQVRGRTRALETLMRENDITSRSLRDSETKFRAVVKQSLVGIAIIEQGRFTYTNLKFDEIFGYDSAEMRALGPADLTAERDLPLVANEMRRRLSGEVDAVEYTVCCRRKDGNEVTVEIQGRVLAIPGKSVLLTMAMDVTERKRVEREVKALETQLREQSNHDALTGLYNRRFLAESLGRELELAGREGLRVSAVLGDLDHFKAVNDRYGHLAGDEVLRVFGALLKSHCRDSDFFCRYGGEEFLLVFPSMTEEIALVRADELRRAVAATPVRFGAATIVVTASFGVAEFPRDGRSDDELIAAADRALYAAKAAGRNQVRSFSSLRSHDAKDNADVRQHPKMKIVRGRPRP